MKPALVLIAACLGSQAIAAPISIPITNFDFETPQITTPPDPNFFAFGVSGWTSSGDTITWQPATAQFATLPDGTQVAALGATGSARESLSQTLTATLLANTTYDLSFYVGAPTGYFDGGYSASLSANGVILASDTNGVTPAAGTFALDTIVYNSGANPAQLGDALTITFNQGTAATSFGGVEAYDVVTLTADTASGAAPEPATMTLMGMALAALAFRRRKV